MSEYPKVRSVSALPGKKLRVTFENGDVRIYDCSPLLSDPPFALLAQDALFRAVQVDLHGYGIVWSDDIDLSESELWLNGVAEAIEAPQS
jgi:hypothetical protein